MQSATPLNSQLPLDGVAKKIFGEDQLLEVTTLTLEQMVAVAGGDSIPCW
jgi:hypothetical protein